MTPHHLLPIAQVEWDRAHEQGEPPPCRALVRARPQAGDFWRTLTGSKGWILRPGSIGGYLMRMGGHPNVRPIYRRWATASDTT